MMKIDSAAHAPETRPPLLDVERVTKAYDRWAPVYDFVFGKVFAKGRLAAAAVTQGSAGRLLEVGVGTGISLPHYPAEMSIVGIDISEPMLAKARRRVRMLGLRNVEALAVMNAEHLEFDDDTFEFVVAQYVVTAVPNPEAALDEFIRVTKPGGEIVLTSRVGAETGMRALVERHLSPVVNRLGWRSEFPWARYERWAATADAHIVERRSLPPFGHFYLIRFTKRPTGAA